MDAYRQREQPLTDVRPDDYPECSRFIVVLRRLMHSGLFVSGPGALCSGPGNAPGSADTPIQHRGPPLRSACHVPAGSQLRSACHSSSPAGPHPIRVPRSSQCHRSNPRATDSARRIPFFQERTPNLIVWGIIKVYHNTYKVIYCNLVLYTSIACKMKQRIKYNKKMI